MAGRTKMAAFAGICEKAFMTAATAFNSSKPIMKDTAIQILVYYFFYVGPQVTVFLAESPVIYSFKFLVVIFYALVIWSVLGLSSSVLFGVST